MKSIAELLFPPICSSCGELLPFEGFSGKDAAGKSQLCPACLPRWKEEKERLCGSCGKPVAVCECATRMMEAAGCKTFCKLVYYHPGNREEVGNRIIYRIKDHPDRATIRFLAQELAPGIRNCMDREEWREKSFFLTFLPRRHSAVLGTGNDQAKELAAALAEELELPLVALIGRHRKSRTPQKFLPPSGRLSNATGAFYLREKRKAEASG